MFHLYTPWKCQKTFGFVTFPGDIQVSVRLKWFNEGFMLLITYLLFMLLITYLLKELIYIFASFLLQSQSLNDSINRSYRSPLMNSHRKSAFQVFGGILY